MSAEPSDEKISEASICDDNVNTCDSYGLSLSDVEFIRRVLKGSVAVGLDADSSAERINEAFSDNLGDVILECDGEAYNLIDDYREDVIEWLEKITI